MPGNNTLYALQLLVDQLRYLSRLYNVAYRSTKEHMVTFITQCVEDLRKLNDSIEIKLNVDRKVKKLTNDIHGGALLALIVSELLDNAKSALGGLGHITVSLSVLQSTNSLCVIVADKGPGVSADIQSRIFENGFSTKGPGRGFGLYLAREGLSRLGGEIRYQTKAGPALHC